MDLIVESTAECLYVILGGIARNNGFDKEIPEQITGTELMENICVTVDVFGNLIFKYNMIIVGINTRLIKFKFNFKVLEIEIKTRLKLKLSHCK